MENVDLQKSDSELAGYIEKELERQQNTIELIASENIVSKSVLEAQGSILTNKYAEGYPARRYYGGCEEVDKVEELAKARLQEIFNAKYSNVQPHSGSQANFSVFLALLKPGDTILGMELESGGHLTHGSPYSVSGKWFNAVFYNVNRETEEIDYEELEKIAIKSKPKLIIAGYSAYCKKLDFKKFREVCDKVGAYLMVDMAHFAGLVATNFYDNPMEYADVVTSTTHKTLRGPRGGVVLTNNQDIYKKINSSVFPGTQGGPLMHIIAAKAAAFKEVLEPSFKDYISQVLKNIKAMEPVFNDNGIRIVGKSSDVHMLILDLSGNNLSGKKAELVLDQVNMTCNKNTIPFDTKKPMVSSGIRIGTPAITSRGFKEAESKKVAELISKIVKNTTDDNDTPADILDEVKAEALELCTAFPIYK